VLGQGFDLGQVMRLGGGPGQHVQVAAGEVGQGFGLPPVPVGGVGGTDLGRVALQRRDPAGDAGFGGQGGPRLVLEVPGGLRARVRADVRASGRPGVLGGGPLGAQARLLAQGQGDVPLLFGQGQAHGGPVDQGVAVDRGGGHRVHRVLGPAQQGAGRVVEVGPGQVAAMMGAGRHLGRNQPVELAEPDYPDAEHHGRDRRDELRH
jgi:hypothetical protein